MRALSNQADTSTFVEAPLPNQSGSSLIKGMLKDNSKVTQLIMKQKNLQTGKS